MTWNHSTTWDILRVTVSWQGTCRNTTDREIQKLSPLQSLSTRGTDTMYTLLNNLLLLICRSISPADNQEGVLERNPWRAAVVHQGTSSSHASLLSKVFVLKMLQICSLIFYFLCGHRDRQMPRCSQKKEWRSGMPTGLVTSWTIWGSQTERKATWGPCTVSSGGTLVQITPTCMQVKYIRGTQNTSLV